MIKEAYGDAAMGRWGVFEWLLAVPRRIESTLASWIGRGSSTGRDEGAKHHSGPGIPGGTQKQLLNSLAAVY
ncbi:hypothetical protein TNCV_2996941 [Trichonephila clavipes]|nr:hypothetical protein TNCV_2996941 [Trichonephila clavipes]